MSGYVITGSADNEDLSTCENISLVLKKKFPNLIIKIIIKHKDEWEEYQDKISRLYGFRKLLNPLIFTTDGILIGSKNEFENYIIKKYNICLNNEIIYDKNLNEKITKKELIKKNYVKNLDDKILISFKKLYKLNKICESNFIYDKVIIDNRELFFKNFENFNSEIDYKKKIEFSLDYLKPECKTFDINEQIKNDLLLEEFNKTEKNIDNKKDKKKVNNKNGDLNNKNEEINNKNGDLNNKNEESNNKNEEINNKNEDINNNLVDENNVKNENNLENGEINNNENSEEKINENLKEDIEEKNSNNSIIKEESEDLDKKEYEKVIENYTPDIINLSESFLYDLENYQIFYHPESFFYHHMILTSKLNNNLYEDYSKINKPRYELRKNLNINQDSHINLKTINPVYPFSENDLKTILKLLKDLDSYLFFRVLPNGEKDNLNLLNNTMHIVKKDGILKILSNFNNNKHFDYKITQNIMDFDKLLNNLNNYYNEDEHFKKLCKSKEFYSVFENNNFILKNDFLEFDISKESLIAQNNLENINFQFEEVKLEKKMKSIKDYDNNNKNNLKNYDLDNCELFSEINNENKNDFSVKNRYYNNSKIKRERTNDESLINIVEDFEYKDSYEKINYINPYSKEFYILKNKSYDNKIYFIDEHDYSNFSLLKDKIYHLIYSYAEENNLDYLNIGYNLIMTKNYIFINFLNEKIKITDNFSLYYQPWNFFNIYLIPQIKKEFSDSLSKEKNMKLLDIIKILNNNLNN